MTERDSEKWNNEGRWDRVHAVLSLEAGMALYPYIGVPFQWQRVAPFLEALRSYLRWLYWETAQHPVPLSRKQEYILRELTALFGAELTQLYVRWYLSVAVYRPYERTPGWSEWYSIMMRCAIREDWWPRLELPAAQDALVYRELDDAKARMDDADKLVESLETLLRSS